jgi:group I intron endonuclease
VDEAIRLLNRSTDQKGTMKTYTIYKATNILTGKSYIGFDSRWPRRRNEHKHAAGSTSSYPFHSAMREYGFNNFYWEVLFESEDQKLTMDAECFYIKIFGSFGSHGYNANIGGGGMAGKNHTALTKQKISESMKKNPTKAWLGKQRSNETKQAISEKNKLYIQSEEQKQKNSIAIQLKWLDPVWRQKVLESRRKSRNVSSV